MDHTSRQLVDKAGRAALDVVASGVLGAPATVVGEPVFANILAPHAEKRTIGVVKLGGDARLADGTLRGWSVVAKLVDLGQEPDVWTRWTRPEIEEIVYEEHYFADDGTRFRPARCYLVSTLEGGIRIFWLEDLTGARRPPFAVADMADMARHLGEWNGTHIALPRLKFELPTDIFAIRADLPNFLRLYELCKATDPAVFRPVYGDVPVAAAHEYRALYRAQNERIKQLPHGLAFGDCQVGNLFAGDGETIAVDWTSLASEPIGADGGALIGSALSWGPGIAEIARHERELFEAYLAGLRAGGWRGNRDDVRRGYFSQFSQYFFNFAAMTPVILSNEIWPPGVVEERLQVGIEEVPALVAPIVARLPAYVDELRELAARP